MHPFFMSKVKYGTPTCFKYALGSTSTGLACSMHNNYVYTIHVKIREPGDKNT